MTDYKCSKCGRTGVRLWREYVFIATQAAPVCFTCAGDRLKDLLPALPFEDTYWCLSSAPHASIRWWHGLRAVPGEPPEYSVCPELNPNYDPEVVKARLTRRDNENIERYIRDTVAVIEATAQEQQDCWCRHAAQSPWRYTPNDVPRVVWEQLNPGQWRQIGNLDSRPVCLSFTWALIHGEVLCFWCPTSEVVDYEMARNYVRNLFAHAKSFTDAADFPNALRATRTP